MRWIAASLLFSLFWISERGFAAPGSGTNCFETALWELRRAELGNESNNSTTASRPALAPTEAARRYKAHQEQKPAPPPPAPVAAEKPPMPADLTPEEFAAYKTMGLDPGSDWDAVTKEFRRRAKSFHPDRFQQADAKAQKILREKQAEMSQAYHLLEKRLNPGSDRK